MGFDDRLWTYLVEEHDAHLAAGAAPFRRRHPAARRGAAAGAVVVAAAISAGVVVLDQPSGESAWAKQVIQRAAAVVVPPSSANTILHVAATETLSPLAQRARATKVSTLSEDAWIQQGAPGGERVIVQVPGGPMLEENSSVQIYNMTNNTVYPAPQLPSGKPHYTLAPISSGSYRLRVTLPHGGVYTRTLSPSTARALRDGTDAVQWGILAWNSRTQTQSVIPLVGPSHSQHGQQQLQAQQPDPASVSFAAELRGLLDSGHARVTRTTTSDGQPAIEITSVHPQSGPRTTYYVDPKTYAPIELDTYGYDSPNDVTRVHFHTYKTLSLAGHRNLLRFTAPTNARVDRTPADYWNAAGLPRPF